MRIFMMRPGAIGDTLLTFPIMQALRTRYHNVHITLVSNPAVLPLALACGIADEVADYNDRQWSELFSDAGLSHLIHPELQSRFRQTDLAIAWLSDADGVVARNLRNAGARQVIVTPGHPPAGKRIHIVEYLAQTLYMSVDIQSFLEPAGAGDGETYMSRDQRATTRVPTPFHPITCSPNRVPAPTDSRLRSNKPVPPSTGNPPIAIHVGSGSAAKCWPPSSFAAIIRELWQRNYPVLLLVGPADTERIKAVCEQLPSPPRSDMLSILENAPLLEVASQLIQCRHYLGNDSGITHLAALLGVPTTVLFGVSDPVIWRPVGPSVKVLHNPQLEDLLVSEVLESIVQGVRV